MAAEQEGFFNIPALVATILIMLTILTIASGKPFEWIVSRKITRLKEQRDHAELFRLLSHMSLKLRDAAKAAIVDLLWAEALPEEAVIACLRVPAVWTQAAEALAETQSVRVREAFLAQIKDLASWPEQTALVLEGFGVDALSGFLGDESQSSQFRDAVAARLQSSTEPGISEVVATYEEPKRLEEQRRRDEGARDLGERAFRTLRAQKEEQRARAPTAAKKDELIKLAVMAHQDASGPPRLVGEDVSGSSSDLGAVTRPALLFVPRETLPYLKRNEKLWSRVQNPDATFDEGSSLKKAAGSEGGLLAGLLAGPLMEGIEAETLTPGEFRIIIVDTYADATIKLRAVGLFG